jgi:hypothetical protein
MQRLIFQLWIATSLCAVLAAPTRADAPIDPVGMGFLGDTLYLADRVTGKIFSSDGEHPGYKSVSQPGMFRNLCGLTAIQNEIYVGDAGRHGIFKFDPLTNKVTKIFEGAPLREPCDFVERNVVVQVGATPSPEHELIVMDQATSILYRLSLSNPESGIRLFGDQENGTFESLSTDDQGLLGIREGTVFRQLSGRGWTRLDLGKATAPAKEIPFFSNTEPLSKITSVRFRSGVYYALNRGILHLVASQGTIAIPTSIGSNNQQLHPKLLAVSNRHIALFDYHYKRVLWLRLLLPVAWNVEARRDVDMPISAFIAYLASKNYLTYKRFTIPKGCMSDHELKKWSYDTQRECVAASQKLTLSSYTKELDQTLCRTNLGICSSGHWRQLTGAEEIFLPVVPFVRYLDLDERTLDGRNSVRALLDFWLRDRADPKGVFRNAANNQILKDLNPEIHVEDMMDLRKQGVRVRFPVLRYRYFGVVEKSELETNESDLAKVVRRYPKLVLMSAENAGNGAGQSSDIQRLNLQGFTDYYNSVLTNLKWKSADNRQDERQANIIVYEINPRCDHPAFFKDEKSNACYGQNTGYSKELLGVFSGGWGSSGTEGHGTCIASLVGARRLPYGTPLNDKVILWKVPRNPMDLKQRINQMGTSVVRAIVNISQESPLGLNDAREIEQWNNVFTSYSADEMLFVLAAGNTLGKLSESELAGRFSSRNNVIVVGASNSSGDGPWEDQENSPQGSRWGERVNLSAPGSLIPCAAAITDEGKPVYSLTTGTSMAAALVSAAAAHLLSRSLRAPEIKLRLISTADPWTTLSSDGSPISLAGRMNMERAVLDFNRVHATFGSSAGSGIIIPTENIENRVEYHLESDHDEQNWISINRAENIKRIFLPTVELSKQFDSRLYRIVFYNSDLGVVIKDRVQLRGCIKYDTDSAEHHLIALSTMGCLNLEGEIHRDLRDFVGHAWLK